VTCRLTPSLKRTTADRNTGSSSHTINNPANYSPAIAPHPDYSPPLLGTARRSVGDRACVFTGCRVHLVVVMSVLDHVEKLVRGHPSSSTVATERLSPGGTGGGTVSAVCPVSVQDSRLNCVRSSSGSGSGSEQCDAPTPPPPATQRRTTRYVKSAEISR